MGYGDAGTVDYLRGVPWTKLDTEKYDELKDTHKNPSRFLKPNKDLGQGLGYQLIPTNTKHDVRDDPYHGLADWARFEREHGGG